MGALRLFALIIWLLVCYLLAWSAKRLGKPGWRDAIARVAFSGVLRIVGIRLTVSGRLSDARPLLLATNHVSYLDVHILGSQAPIRFTPKSEINGWPGIGAICRVLDCVFIDRRPEKAAEARDGIVSALAKSEVVCLFPEASTGNGIHLLPFKSSLFSLAEQPIGGKTLTVQPAAIRYTRIKRLPIDRTQWPQIAWYGDMDLLPHLWQLLSLAPIDAELVFLPPLDRGNRKELAARCQKAIAAALETTHALPAGIICQNGLK